MGLLFSPGKHRTFRTIMRRKRLSTR